MMRVRASEKVAEPPSSRVAIGCGLVLFGSAYGWLILTNSEIRASADPGAETISLAAAALPPLVAIVLARLVGPGAAVPEPLPDVPRQRIGREAAILVLVALVFPLVTLGSTQTFWYPLSKTLLFLVVPLVAFRLMRADGPIARAIPKPVVWLAPLPAAAAWFVLAEVWPFARPVTQELPDPVTLAVGSLLTLLTASVLEEVFYRGWLQTRLEALYGRWPAVVGASLLFAGMHLSRVFVGDVGTGLAGIVAYQGMFGLMLGYLWSRYRNIWVVIAIHVAVNLVYVDLLFGWFRS